MKWQFVREIDEICEHQSRRVSRWSVVLLRNWSGLFRGHRLYPVCLSTLYVYVHSLHITLFSPPALPQATYNRARQASSPRPRQEHLLPIPTVVLKFEKGYGLDKTERHATVWLLLSQTTCTCTERVSKFSVISRALIGFSNGPSVTF